MIRASKTVQIGLVIIQRRAHHIGTERALCMAVEAAHDARHVNAFLLGLQADRPGDRGFQHQIAIVARVVADGQAEIGNADMLDRGLSAHDQAGGAVLQIGQARLVIGIGAKALRVIAVQIRIGQGRQQASCRGFDTRARIIRRAIRKAAQGFQRRLRLCFRGGLL